MAVEPDDIVSLPSPPPPRPAARRQAIDAALRRFDGIEDRRSAAPARRPAWATLHRRPAGALVAATLIAVVAIPAIQVALKDQPEIASEETAAPGGRPIQPKAPAAAADPLDATSASDAEGEPPQSPSAQPAAAEERPALARAAESGKADAAAPAMFDAPVPVAAAPPPPPPPPPTPAPPAEPEADAAVASSEIVVSGSRISRPQLEAASPVTVIASHDEFLGRLRAAFRAKDRRAVLRLVGFPLRVHFEDGPRTYSSVREVERDFERIFTPEVRRSAFTLTTADLRTSEDGRLSGNGTLWFGCASRTCASGVRIREVRP